MHPSHPESRPPQADPVPELLEQLLLHVRCDVCGEHISAFEMIVIWPLAHVTAHLACYVDGRSLGTMEASS